MRKPPLRLPPPHERDWKVAAVLQQTGANLGRRRQQPRTRKRPQRSLVPTSSPAPTSALATAAAVVASAAASATATAAAASASAPSPLDGFTPVGGSCSCKPVLEQMSAALQQISTVMEGVLRALA